LRQIDIERLTNLKQHLTKKEIAIIILYFVDNYSQEQIAQRYKCSRCSITYAVKNINKKLTSMGLELPEQHRFDYEENCVTRLDFTKVDIVRDGDIYNTYVRDANNE
jgi:predicted DNA-binding protein YlxM (UPF0122 family)